MEVLAVSTSKPRFHNVGNIKLYTAIVCDPSTSPSDYIELDQSGILDNKLAVHDGPWCSSSVYEALVALWPKRLMATHSLNSGRVGAYLQILTGGRVYPGDQASYESFSGDPLDLARITQLAFDNSLKTRDTINLLLNHKMLMRMNKWILGRKATNMDDKQREGRNAWKGFRDLRVRRIVNEGGDIKSFYLGDLDGQPLANYLPGQFLTIRLPDGTTRSWKISDWEDEDEPSYYRISIRRVGVASTWTHDICSLNTILSAGSPAGRFTPTVHPSYD
ncbi:hypothetical protein CHU98_g11450 [Xylaria longipes]|nr:hypothetical protein CHU98_g11450 [Xylaria longipes]